MRTKGTHETSKNTVVAVADGATLNLFRNTGDEDSPSLTALSDANVPATNKGSGGRHQSSSVNPSDSQQDENGFAAGVTGLLNKRVLDGKIDNLVVIAAPRTLGELRKHYTSRWRRSSPVRSPRI